MQHRTHLGWIALDIDGTLTSHAHHIPEEVLLYLKQLYEGGWDVVFITGRFFSFAIKTLSDVPFPFFLALQNGADIFKMPGKKLIAREYLPKEIIEKVDLCYQGLSEDFIVYGGADLQDIFYFRDTKFSKPMLEYMVRLQEITGTPGKKISDFTKIPFVQLPCIKCFGSLEEMQQLEERLSQEGGLTQTVIADPFYPGVYLNLITHPLANKGAVMDVLQKHTGLYGPIIGAGNDLNDLSLLQRADFSIAIENSPEQLLEAADFVALHPDVHGIIEGIKTGIKQLKGF